MKKNKPIHFIYRDYENQPLTEVWVSDDRESVKFKNYTDNPVWTCFGVKTEATWNDVLHFFQKRCFDPHCANLEFRLKVHHLREYDPYLICRQNKGKCASDDNWIEFLKKRYSRAIQTDQSAESLAVSHGCTRTEEQER